MNPARYAQRAVHLHLGLMLAFSAGCGPSSFQHTAEDGPVRLSISTNRALPGDVFQAELEIHHDPSALITPPTVDRGNELTVLERDITTKKRDTTTSVTRIRYDLQSFAVGIYDVTTNPVSIRQGDEIRTLEIPNLPIEVGSSLESEEEALGDLKDPVLWPRTHGNRMFWALLTTALLALVAGITGFLIRRARKRPTMPPAPVIPAHEIALNALRALKEESWLQQGQFDRYYVRLSDIVRQYLENRFALHAPEQTTEEFIREAAEHAALDAAQQEQVRAFLIQSDLVKFARFTPTLNEADDAYDSAVQLVEETRAAEEGPS